MSPNYSTRYKRMIGGRPCIGFRLNLRKISIRRLRARFIRFFGLLRKRLFSRMNMFSASSGSIFSKRRPESNKTSMKKRCESSEYYRMKSLGRTNSFYTEAIADCLEFIKRSSGASSLDISSPHYTLHLTSTPKLQGLNSS